MVERYQNLSVCDKTVSTPYYINNIEQYFIDLMKKEGISDEKIHAVHKAYKNNKVPYGWTRGKGTPEELEQATTTISEKVGFSLSDATEDGVIEFMKLFGLGVDCAGLVYHMLSFAFQKNGKFDEFENSLAWGDPEKRGASRAGAFVFAKTASNVVEPSELQPLDFILIKGWTKEYVHIAIVLEKNKEFFVVQSSIASIPTGVNVTKLFINDGKPQFEYKPTIGKEWENLYREGTVEFRRLSILK